MKDFIQKHQSVLLAIIALFAGGFFAEVVIDTSDDGKDRTIRVEIGQVGETTKVDGPDQDVKPDDVVKISETAEGVAEEFIENPEDLEADQPGAAPLEGTTPHTNVNVIPAPLGADEIDGCRTRFLDVNFSQRSLGQDAVIWFALHFTGGTDISNSRADVDGLTAYGNRASSRVSWHFNVDKDGNCDYNVPLRLKAWTFGNANSRSVNVEVHGRGEPPYLRPAGYKKLASIIKQVRASYPQIQLRLGAVSNCGPGRSGIVTHWMGGSCSGGHTDIRPHEVRAVIERIQHYSGPSPLDKARRSHRILHAKLVDRCRGSQADSTGCKILRSRNRALHKKYPRALG